MPVPPAVAPDPPAAATPAAGPATTELAGSLVAAGARLVRLVSAAADVPLSTSQARVLAVLAERGPVRVTELARREHCSQPAMTALVDRLEAAGCVRRTPDAADGRATLVSITDAGREQRAALREAMAAVLAPRLHRLDGADLDRLRDCAALLHRLTDDLEPEELRP